MAPARDRKLFLGPRLRMLRRELGLTQTRMAEELGVSPSYLNHLERNQRPLTAPMLLRLADTYDLDMRGFVAGARDAAVGDLTEIMADDLTRDLTVDRQETLEVAENYPNVAEAMKRLYRAVVDLRQQPGRIESGLAQGGAASPIAWAREWVDASRNHFAAIDLAAEALAAGIGGDAASIETALRDRLAAPHAIGVRIVPQETLPAATWHYDFHRRRLLLSERLAPASRLFALALHLARLELAGPIGETLAGAGAPDREAAALGRRVLDAYAAAAILMPYRRFLDAAEAGRYDLDLLAARFGTSIEQVAHRLTTLSRANQAGVPLFLLKLDLAGNVVKRFSGVRGPFTSFGGGCPRWRVHDALRSAGGSVVDLAELPDGSRFLTWARAVHAWPQHRPSLLILGCDVRDAARVGYLAAATGAPTPIGIACHLCERERCEERSLPPITRALATDPTSRPIGRYRFGAV